jgi:methyl-accepting chemotaxis protein
MSLKASKSIEWRIAFLIVVSAFMFVASLVIGAQFRSETLTELDTIDRVSGSIDAIADLQTAVYTFSLSRTEGLSTTSPETRRNALLNLERAAGESIGRLNAEGLSADASREVVSVAQSIASSAATLRLRLEASGDPNSADSIRDYEQALSVQLDRLERHKAQLRGQYTLSSKQVQQRIWDNGWLAAALAVATCCLGVATAFVVFAFVVRPTREHTLAMRKLEAGDIDIELPEAASPGQMGDMARSILSYRESIIKRRDLEAEASAERLNVEQERRKKEEMDQYYIAAHKTFLDKFTAALERFSDGDVKYRLDQPFIAEYEGIRHAFNEAAGKIQNAIVNIAARSIEIRGGTERILAAADELSRHTEEQASSLEETSASMEQMAATIRQNASNAQEASAASVVTRNLAVAGGQVADQAVGAIEKIERSSKQMTEIVSLIEEIAFQTNILALNAAVEAARAGDAGKGFGVVANEVRALSQRSSRSLKDIKSLIDSSSVDVADGVRLVKQAGGSLTDIAQSVKKAADLVAEIAAASHEQAVGVDQVSRAVANMDEMTQQNAALVQETTAALHAAQTWINELHRVVSVFDAGAASADLAELKSDATWLRGRPDPVEDHLQGRRGKQKRSRGASASRTSAAFDRDWQEL